MSGLSRRGRLSGAGPRARARTAAAAAARGRRPAWWGTRAWTPCRARAAPTGRPSPRTRRRGAARGCARSRVRRRARRLAAQHVAEVAQGRASRPLVSVVGHVLQLNEQK